MTTATRTASVLLVGNPNVGKSTLFNALTGSRQHVVNAPGTTVELMEGTWTPADAPVTLVDLPGTYSLIARSPDEQVAASAVRDDAHDLAVVVVDATALSRSLYVLGQVARAGRPVVVALTMTDLAASRGQAPDVEALRASLGVPVVAVNGRSRAGLDGLAEAVANALHRPTHVVDVPPPAPDADLEDNLAHAQDLFDWVERVADAALPVDEHRHTLTDRVDRVLLNPWAGVPAFLAVVWAVLQLTTVVATPLMDAAAGLIDGPVAESVAAGLASLGAPAWVGSFATGGLLAGVATVLSFIPLMALIFASVTILESSGYLARVAVVTDRAMRAIGLDGRAMLPLIVGFGCNVPAVSATAVLPHARQRLLTGLLVPLTTCTARLTVYLLLAHAFFPGHAGTVVFGMYVASIALVVLGGLVARRTVMRDLRPEPLLIALPDYQWPHLRTLVAGVWTRVLSFVRKAGTVILAAVALLWVLQAIPVHGDHAPTEVPIEDSLYGATAQAVAPAFAPMGLDDWRIASSLVAGVAAKEVVVGALAQAYSVEDPGDSSDSAEATTLGERIRATLVETSGGSPGAAALAFMVFVLGYLPCLATLAEQRRLYGWRWTAGAAGAQFALAYVLATAVFQVGRLL
ncbi:ferrous iron transporter B [Demequina pelophila]|uniref:ferrous iron transporter B n=1 Tax=Demequina pelophila TaxID=1638984 RepID=UPI0007858920|nr:ferrous iron transporter B [Demequina pelophila]